MTLTEALQITRKPSALERPVFEALLGCGFTPLHLETLLAAHLQTLLPDRRVRISTGLYGDLRGTISHLNQSAVHAAAIVMEWPDLDPRLGIRQLGGWRPRDLEDIRRNAAAYLEWIREPIRAAAGRFPIALSLPTLPLPPAAFTPGWQASHFELALREPVCNFGAWASTLENVRVLNAQRLDRISPVPARLDVKSELLTGFSYTLAHADAVAQLLARLMRAHTPKKGLITDLDNTLWSGVVGEVGGDGVSWDLGHHSQLHGIYQQLLCALAEQGVLLAVASKNDPAFVEEAFARPDIQLPKDRCFPLEIHWQVKSESVGRILKAWNIGADSVVLVDDSPMELAEVKAAYPEIECLLFPAKDYAAAWELFQQLRDLFGKERFSAEDALRLESLRAASTRAEEAQSRAADPDEFLKQTEAKLQVSFRKLPADPRALELVNKTNQFNLNGIRYNEAEWQGLLEDPTAFVLIVSYQDKYGPLGKISVAAGKQIEDRVHIGTWVISCRAFARRIEHRCLEMLFEKFGAREIVLDFTPTQKNAPIRDFLREFGACEGPPARIRREAFAAKCPALFHTVEYLN